MLYWADAISHTIERCGYDGQRRSTVIKVSVHGPSVACSSSVSRWVDSPRRICPQVVFEIPETTRAQGGGHLITHFPFYHVISLKLPDHVI